MLTKIPTVSVIIPTYNRAYLIGRAIQSVLDQTYQDFEIIVVDDGSTDDTEEMIKQIQEYDKRIRYSKHKQNNGASAARNTGIKLARGKYIAFLDSDDEWLPKKLELEVNILKKDRKFAICSTGYRFIDKENGKVIGKSSIRNQIISQRIVLRGQCMTTNDFTVTKKMAIKIDGFDEKISAREDWDFWIRITSLGLGFQDSLSIVNKYTMRSDQISSGIRNKLQGTEALFKKHKELFLLDSLAYQGILSNLGVMHLLNGSYVDAVTYFRQACKHTKKWSKRTKLTLVIAIMKIFGGCGSKALISYYRFKNPNSYMLW